RAAPAGYMLMVRPMEQVRRLVQQQVGARAALKLDDIPAQTAAMRAVMRQAWHRCSLARNGIRALDLLAQAEHDV
ncbi:MAG TPA: hypothetical protein PLK31_13615, partial [Chloroflexota bacterium]|nr:hypothetical protein [Chloroflexota bacterium]